MDRSDIEFFHRNNMVETRLNEIGIKSPFQIPFTAIHHTDTEQGDLGNQAIVGTPYYIFSSQREGRETNIIDAHESIHLWLSTHIVPNQPIIDLPWENVSVEEVTMVGATNSNSEVKEAAKNDLLMFPAWREFPLEALKTLEAKFYDKIHRYELRRALANRRNFNSTELPIYPRLIRVVQIYTSQLKFNIERAQKISDEAEEGIVTYLSNRACSKDPEQWVFVQSDYSIKLALRLAREFPDPRHITGHIEEKGFDNFITYIRPLL